MTPAAYRPDVDGLRAVAVLSVVAFHLNADWLPGGFVGVDIFFVISGYLITGIVWSELAAGRFSLKTFYQRRILRIVPAYYLVLAASFLVAALVLMPVEFDAFSMSARASVLFAANFWFAQRIDYFDQASEQDQLLHLWSLAVEEQFYIVFPLLLTLLVRFAGTSSRRALLLVLVLGAASLAASIAMAVVAPRAGFFMPYTRAFELMIGALLAISGAGTRLSPAAREAAGALGLALIAGSFVLLSEELAYPGGWALLPCLGAGLIILSGTDGQPRVTAALRWQVSIAIGLGSYSLYLWHWPVIAFARTLGLDPAAPATTASLLLLMAVLSAATWRFVEQPVRSWRHKEAARAFGLFAGLSLATLAVTVVVEATDGLPQRIPPRVAGLMAANEEWRTSDRLACMSRWSDDSFDLAERGQSDSPCRLGTGERRASVVLWGDSHAAALAPGVDAALAELEIGGLLVAKAGCPPLVDPRIGGSELDGTCQQFTTRVLDGILAVRPDAVILVARWTLIAEGGTGVDLRFAPPLSASLRRERLKAFEEAAEALAVRLDQAGIPVILVHTVPEPGINVPSAIAVSDRFGFAEPVGPEREAALLRQHATRAALDRAARRHDWHVVDPLDVLCSVGGACRIEAAGEPLYFDSNHLTVRGAETLSPDLAEGLAPLLRRN
ncbi:acyltransferase family protein [Stappia indica]|uniref:Acyltransferase family protein n=1 Tax=Stappia indica TaxID=538381 RepID=A0A857CCW7_9HYPH|nr:acyltransferase family protein [Stappia indica]QGZ36864.1 acyltransferase family protein [Stappia indica]